MENHWARSSELAVVVAFLYLARWGRRGLPCPVIKRSYLPLTTCEAWRLRLLSSSNVFSYIIMVWYSWSKCCASLLSTRESFDLFSIVFMILYSWCCLTLSLFTSSYFFTSALRPWLASKSYFLISWILRSYSFNSWLITWLLSRRWSWRLFRASLSPDLILYLSSLFLCLIYEVSRIWANEYFSCYLSLANRWWTELWWSILRYWSRVRYLMYWSWPYITLNLFLIISTCNCFSFRRVAARRGFDYGLPGSEEKVLVTLDYPYGWSIVMDERLAGCIGLMSIKIIAALAIMICGRKTSSMKSGPAFKNRPEKQTLTKFLGSTGRECWKRLRSKIRSSSTEFTQH